jgi:CubicO group peptidase (beta-lactamase class C family)
VKEPALAFARLTLLALCAAFGGTACGSSAPYVYEAPASTGDGWDTAHAATVDLDPAPLTDATNAVRAGEYSEVDSILVVRHGRLVHEVYFGDYDRAKVHDLRSATKSVTSILVGIAIDQGLLPDADAYALPLLPAYANHQNPDPRKAEIRLRHLLTMTPGLDCNDGNGASPGNEEKMYGKDDWVRFILDLPMVADPGQQWAYCTGGVVTLGAVLAGATGRRADAFARESLFAPLGITDYHWEYTPSGQVDTGGHLHLRPRDMAKLGQLMLNRGAWNGARLLSEDWVRVSTARQALLPNGGQYGYLWWRLSASGTEVFYADGNGGQQIMVAPALDLVVVFTGSHYNSAHGMAFELLYKFILPAVRS